MHTKTLTDRYSREQAKRIIDAAPNGYVMSVGEPKRTQAQNNKLWAMLTELSMAKPNGRAHSPDTWKLLAMHACGFECQFEMGLNGQPFPVGFRSSKLTKAQMSALLEWITAYAAEAGVELRG